MRDMPRPRVSDPAWEKSNFRTVSKEVSARSEFNDGTHLHSGVVTGG